MTVDPWKGVECHAIKQSVMDGNHGDKYVEAMADLTRRARST